ncbi:MAG: hypothetical protein JXA45_03055, partial [Methanomassiliicoccales archaeon]|nr:hypothetical protein [Methanomassiliicoccales archaeon]
LRQILAEGEDFDLLTMGRPEGPGCYCYVNDLLRLFVDRLMSSYDHVVIDNEAGMEHLSRRTARDIDLLLLVSDPTPVGVNTAKRLSDLADELSLKVRRRFLLINGLRPGEEARARELAAVTDLDHVVLHEDESVRQASFEGLPLTGDGSLAQEVRTLIAEFFPSSKRK